MRSCCLARQRTCIAGIRCQLPMSAQLGEGPEALSKTGAGRALVQTTGFPLFELIGVSQQ